MEDAAAVVMLTCTQVSVKGDGPVQEPVSDTSRNDTAARVLDVAERLVQVRGFNGFSYGDVAGELGITRAALHYHFPGKAELGEALIARYADRFTAALAELGDKAPATAAKLAGYAELYAAVLERDRMCLCGMLAAEYQTLPQGMQRRVSNFFEHNTAWLRDVLEQGRRDGDLAFPGSPDDAAAMVLGGLEGALLISRMDGDVTGFRAVVTRLLTGLTAAAQHAGAAGT
jgi:TetR/AcrR family transcriptional regulator, transcriptional repressor for nem operon